MAVNVKAPFMLVQALLSRLQAAASDAEPARVINIGSIYGVSTHVQTRLVLRGQQVRDPSADGGARRRAGAAPDPRERDRAGLLPLQDDALRR